MNHTKSALQVPDTVQNKTLTEIWNPAGVGLAFALTTGTSCSVKTTVFRRLTRLRLFFRFLPRFVPRPTSHKENVKYKYLM